MKAGRHVRTLHAQHHTWCEVHDLYGLTGAACNLQAHYNIAPTDTVDVVRPADGGATELVPTSAYIEWSLTRSTALHFGEDGTAPSTSDPSVGKGCLGASAVTECAGP